MKISGFTIVRNGVKFDYPFVESIKSLLPLVDEMIVNVGVSDLGDDDTLARVTEISPEKIVAFESKWPLDDPEKKRGGQILSEQTNLALERCTGDWCIYLQADEVFHEEDSQKIRSTIERADPKKEVDGVLFNYLHFYGSYGVVQESRSAYRREVRAIRNRIGVQSVGDAQSFRNLNGSKPKVISSEARIFHYGWVRSPDAMRAKTHFMDELYHGDNLDDVPHTGDNYRYKRFWGLKKYDGTHPQVMRDRIAQKGWNWDLENSPLAWNFKDIKKVSSDLFERFTGIRPFEYRSYDLLEDLNE